MNETPADPIARAGDRAAKNTVVRAAAEILGRLATLILFAALGRAVGQSGVGAYVAALAFVQIATMPVYFGFDRYLLRRVARDRSSLEGLFFNVLALKLLLAVPVVAIGFALLNIIGYDTTVRTAAYVLTAGLLLDSLARTLDSVYTAHERAGILSTVQVFNRALTAALGVTALVLGLGVVGVAVTFTLGSAAALVLTLTLLRHRIGMPPLRISRRAWAPLVAASFPFAVQEILTVLIERIDAVMLSLLSGQAEVGLYGAAYRLFEASFFVSWSVTGAFSAMFTYLSRESVPSVQAVFQRAVKLLVVLLTPFAVVIGVLAEPIARLVFGPQFGPAAEPLRLLAPAIVLVGVVTLSTTLVLSRRGPGRMVRVTALMVVINVGLNLVLIPRFAGEGAAAAMLATEGAFVAVTLLMAARAVGGLKWRQMLAGPLLAGLAMAVPLWVLGSLPGLAAVAGVATYLVAFVTLERAWHPGDLIYVINVIDRGVPAFLRPLLRRLA